MPRAAAHAATQTQDDTRAHIEALLQAARHFMPRARGEALFQSWLAKSPHASADLAGVPEYKLLAHMADAVLLTADLLLSQPSSSGATAFDRLAKTLTQAPPQGARALAALRAATFRLLRLEITTDMQRVAARDMVTGALLHIVETALPQLDAGIRIFARAVMLTGSTCCLAGAITPLDDAAFAVAIGHAAKDGKNPAAAARWAEAIYAHVVAHGTLDIPGLNRPREHIDLDAPDSAFDDPKVLALTSEWIGLAGRAPDESLLRRTRAMADPMPMLESFNAAAIARAETGHQDTADAIERLLLVQMETVLRRERAGTFHFTLDGLRQQLDHEIGEGLHAGARALFLSLRRRLQGEAKLRPDDPALERLLTVIRGLRAKTVAQGCTEQEALAAAEKIADLLDRYGLSLGELDFRAQPCEGLGIETKRHRFAPIDSCVPGIAAFFDCRVWAEHPPGTALHYVFFGVRADVAAAQYLYEMVERAFETETNAFRAGGLYPAVSSQRRCATSSFQIGLSHGISAKLAKLRGQRDAHLRTASSRDLVPVKAAMLDDEIAKLGLDLKQRQAPRPSQILTGAFEAGEAAGERFEFSQAIARAA